MSAFENSGANVNDAPDQTLGFGVLCVQKAVEFSKVDHKLHRAAKDAELHEELEKLTNAGPSVYHYQLGGGCRIVGSSGSGGVPISSACVGDSVAAFQGSLTNVKELSEQYVPEPQDGPGKHNPAEVICHMYLKVGVELLTKLRGRFAFCMYESKSGRVLAARDGSGAVHLYQGHSPSEGLVIASTRAMMTTCSDLKAFNPGDFKYGWHSEPRQFSPMEFSRGARHSHNGRKSQSDLARKGSLDSTNRRSADQRCSVDQRRSSDQRRSNEVRAGGSSLYRHASADKASIMKAIDAANGSNSGKLPTMKAVLETESTSVPSVEALQAGNGSASGRRRGGKGRNRGAKRQESASSFGSRGSTEKQTSSRTSLSGQMTTLSVAAPEFHPGTCGGAPSVISPVAAPTAV